MDATKILSEREIMQRVDRMLLHLDRLLVAKEMDAVRDLASWEESAMLAPPK